MKDKEKGGLRKSAHYWGRKREAGGRGGQEGEKKKRGGAEGKEKREKDACSGRLRSGLRKLK